MPSSGARMARCGGNVLNPVTHSRWFRIGAACAGAALIGAVAVASCAVPGFDLVESVAQQGGGGAGGEISEGGSIGGSGACNNVEPPLAPTTTDPGSDIDFVAAMRTVDFGESFDKDVGPTVGYDLDARCTCRGDESSCATVGNQPEDCDGPGGRDNAVARLFDNLSLFTEDSFDSTYQSARANMGNFSILFRVSGWNGAPNDEDVQLAIYTSQGNG